MFLFRFLFRLLVTLVALLGVAAIAIALLPAFGEVSDKAIAHSVAREVGGSVNGDRQRCRRANQRSRRLRCTTPDSSAGGRVTYRVTMRDRRCWEASQTSPQADGEPLKRRATGCVGFADQVRPLRFL